MKIEAVIFDFGGVLVRTEDQSGRQHWEERLGLSPGELSRLVFGSDTAFQATIGSVPEAKIWTDLAARLNLSEPEIANLRRDFWSGDRLDHSLIDFIAGLRPRYKTAILSNAWSDARRLFTDTYRLNEVMDTIMISSEEGIAKPDPAIYLRLVDRLSLAPNNAIFVDDFPDNIIAARQAGMIAIPFQSSPQVIEQIKQLL